MAPRQIGDGSAPTTLHPPGRPSARGFNHVSPLNNMGIGEQPGPFWHDHHPRPLGALTCCGRGPGRSRQQRIEQGKGRGHDGTLRSVIDRTPRRPTRRAAWARSCGQVHPEGVGLLRQQGVLEREPAKGCSQIGEREGGRAATQAASTSKATRAAIRHGNPAAGRAQLGSVH